MTQISEHTFHIPVMGLGFTIDTPAKVAHYGISSVVSIVEDHLIEQMREVLCKKYGQPYQFLATDSPDSRANRITTYLNLLQKIVRTNTHDLAAQPFVEGSEINKYFELMPE